MAQHYTIDRRRPDVQFERTVVGKDGAVQPSTLVEAKGKDGHFTNEGQYRRAIESAAKSNRLAWEADRQ